ncbi:unnamed protein product [Enterobius vermicularis]|uniref:PNPLA domain-containing protein n=1 Tax=Enterobius vermicularis TaxID=51028 RepID=A0A3P6IHY4_ENTVE|nr:unnamed protein product [Enterobius vermicularis]
MFFCFRAVTRPVIADKVSRTELVNRTRGLVSSFLLAETSVAKLSKVEELNHHFTEFPSSRIIALKNSHFVCTLLRISERSSNEKLKERSRQCLSILGYVDDPKGAGIRILSIDGGGTRGMMCLEVLQVLENSLCGPKLSDVFDYIIGVSTGAIIAVLITAKGFSIKTCKEYYMQMSKDLFNQGRLSGVSGLLTSHSYYNTKKWVRLLKQVVGEDSALMDSCCRKGAPKLGVVSSIANTPALQPYIFRNYDLLPGRESHFKGGCDFLLWQAIQASAAAPGYFEEVALGPILHQDGGILANNPTALALHEARLLWPNERILCVVSIGSGRSVVPMEPTELKLATGLQDKITRIVDSATDTELVHLAMQDLLPADSYFRFNPYMSSNYSLDEVDSEKLVQMGQDAQLYLRRNRAKIKAAAATLLKKPSVYRRFIRFARHFSNLQGFFLPPVF